MLGLGPFETRVLRLSELAFAAHGFAFDLHHGIGDLGDHRLLLALVENAFDELNVDKWHDGSFLVLVCRVLAGSFTSGKTLAMR